MSLPAPELWQPVAFGALLVMFRVAALIAMLPAFGEVSIPARVKLALALCFTLAVWPAVIATGQLQPQLQSLDKGWITLIASEIAIGLWFGILLRVFVFSLQVAGSIAAQSTSLAQILGTAGVEPLPAMGHVITMAGLTLALSFGLHIYAVQYVIGSYTLAPIGQLPSMAQVTQSGVAQIASAFQLAFAMAAPFFILSLLYNFTLGVINRAMPQLMVAFVGAPVITAGALMLLAVAIPLMLQSWLSHLMGFVQTGVF